MYPLLTALALAADPAASDKLTLTGTVQDEKGQPIARATVFIRTAAPRKGVGVL